MILEYLANRAPLDNRDQQEAQACKETVASLEFRDRMEQKVALVSRAYKVQQEMSEQLAYQVVRVPQELMDSQEARVCLGLLVPLERRETRA